ncbi:hypothetical protein [Mucilaginibacter sp. R-33]|uniref:hypothetical protein n=1 Tax=unclassified Mucilaginibacter TaxID=2617802 RepID=UPI003CEA08ED
MKKQLNPIYFLILTAIVLLNSCKKNMMEDLKNPNNNSSNKALGVSAITPYSFNWETGDYMPTPSGTSILKPWASGSNQSFPLLYATDIKAADGWQLVYNTFNTTQLNPPLYFVLYNRYRGVLRAYFYLSPTTPIPSSNVTHTLVQRTTGAVAHLISYSALNAADLSVVSNTTSLAQPFKTTATGTWYAAEFEMAYDPAVGTKPANTNLMSWEVNSINVSNLTLNGTSQGSITGTIAQPAPPSPNMFNKVINGAFQLGSLVELGPVSAGASVLKTALTDALKSGLSGSVKNVSNGIFGGATTADSTRQYVHLTTNTSYTFTGTSTDIYQLANISLVIPGSQNQTTATGYVPLYQSPLGLMTLSAAPTAKLIESDYDWGTVIAGAKFDINSYSIVWNPTIINGTSTGASIANIKQEILSYENIYDTNNTTTYNEPWPLGKTEYDGINPYLNLGYPTSQNGYAFAIRSQDTCPGCDYGADLLPYDNFIVGQKMPNHVLRISFDVVPNNGAPKIKVVKSFNIIMTGTVYQ